MTTAQQQQLESFKVRQGDNNSPSTLGGQLLSDPESRSAFNRKPDAPGDAQTYQVMFGGDGPVKKIDPKDEAKQHELLSNLDRALGAKDSKESEKQVKDLLELRKKVYGEKSPEVCDALNLLGWVCNLDGRFKDAKEYYQQGVKFCSDVYGKDGFQTGMQIWHVAEMDASLKNDKEAVANYKEALRIFENADLRKDPAADAMAVMALKDYARLLDRMGDKAGAEAARKREEEIALTWFKKGYLEKERRK